MRGAPFNAGEGHHARSSGNRVNGRRIETVQLVPVYGARKFTLPSQSKV